MRVGSIPARPHVDVCRFRRWVRNVLLFIYHACCGIFVYELYCCLSWYAVVIGLWHIVFNILFYFVSPPSICCVGYFVCMILISLLWPWPALRFPWWLRDGCFCVNRRIFCSVLCRGYFSGPCGSMPWMIFSWVCFIWCGGVCWRCPVGCLEIYICLL